jgi:hypothetical protein
MQSYSPQQGTAAKPTAGSTVAQLYPAPGGYYIAGPAVVAGSANTAKGTGGGPGNGGAPTPGYIYGPYGSYPYGPGRVIGPIIAIGRQIKSRNSVTNAILFFIFYLMYNDKFRLMLFLERISFLSCIKKNYLKLPEIGKV